MEDLLINLWKHVAISYTEINIREIGPKINIFKPHFSSLRRILREINSMYVVVSEATHQMFYNFALIRAE